MTHQVLHRQNVSVNDLKLETSPESRSWKRRKKCQNEAEITGSSRTNTRRCGIPLQTETLQLTSSKCTQDHHKHNYRLSYFKICDSAHRYKSIILALFQSFVIQLSISMNISTLLSKRECCETKTRILKRKKNFLHILKLNLMRFCSLSTFIVSSIILYSNLGIVCHGLKNEFCK